MSSSAVPTYVAALPDAFVIEVQGSDAAKVINNLSTNDVLKLGVGSTFETFISDARGWVVAHAGIVKQNDRIWLLGSHNAPQRICQHIERYIIREDARVVDHSTTHGLLVIDRPASLLGEIASSSPLPAICCSLPILGVDSVVHVVARGDIDQILRRPTLDSSQGSIDQPLICKACSPAEFEWLRISNFWPLQSLDIPDKTIPQELGRDQCAISFTKGCYLGQETIARLDARGQLQKKFCLIELDAETISPEQDVTPLGAGDALFSDDKQVGSITSLAHNAEGTHTRALAIVRRGHFATGSQLVWQQRAARVIRSDVSPQVD